MQTIKDKQQQMFKWEHLPEKTLAWLEGNWPGVWQREIIPMIDEGQFAGLYCADDGRASKATADMVGILLLKEMEDLTDEETVGRVVFDIRWQYALDLAPDEAYVAPRTLQYFRAKVVRSGAHRDLFADITDKIMAALGTRHATQRKDSTHILSNMAHLTRLQLFVKTISVFLKQLKDVKPGRYEQLGQELRARYIERGGGRFADARGSESRRRVEQCATDAWLLLETFKTSKKIRALDGYRLLRRLFSEQCSVEPGEQITLRSDVSGESLQSPFDPDAGYSGHKGKGYQAQLTETCEPENAVQIITHAAVESAAASDAESPVRDTEELHARGIKPDTLLADTAYCGGDNDVALRDMGVALIGPAAGKDPGADAAQIGVFETTNNLRSVTRCPAGNQPENSAYDPDYDTITAIFTNEQCARCDLRNICGVKRRKQGYALCCERSRMATSKRRIAEKSEEFKKAYAARAGIEAANSELKRAHGLGRLRVRGRPAVECAVFMKIAACNIKRYMKVRIEQVRQCAIDAKRAAATAISRQNAPASDAGRRSALVFRLSALSLGLAA
jgi:hypothetical protein